MMFTDRQVLVALFRGRSAIARAIQWQTRSPYSHAGLLFADGLYVEAREFVGVRSLRGLPRNGEIVELFRVAGLTGGQEQAIREFVLAQLGKPYDYLSVVRFVSRRHESRASRAKWFCSELVAAAFARAGVWLLRATHPWEVSPGLLGRSPLLLPCCRESFTIYRPAA